MKYVAAIVFAIFMMSATSTLVENPGFNIDETVNGQFPRSFFIKGNMMSNTGVPGNATFRFDGNNNAFSISHTYRNTAFPKNVTETEAYYFVNNMTYMHTTGNDYCMANRMQMTLPMNVIDFIDAVWYNYARIVYDKWIGGHHFQSINVPYHQNYNLTFHSDNDSLYKVNGTAMGYPFSVNVTVGITPANFQIREHIPRSCPL